MHKRRYNPTGLGASNREGVSDLFTGKLETD